MELNQTQKAFLKAHPKIRIGCMNAWPPMNFVDSSGTPDGIGVDYLKLLSRRLGDIFEIVPGPFKENLQKVKNKKIDAIMDITPKPDRAEYLKFTQPYLTIPHVIVARRNGPYYEKEEDLKGKTLALEKGFYNIKYFKSKYPDLIRIEEYPDTAQALGAVSRGRADAYAGNRAVAAWIIENELLSNLQIQGRLAKPGSVLTIGVRKDWPALASILDKALSDLSPEEISAIHRQWAGFDSAELQRAQLTAREKAFLEAHKKMRLGVDPAWAPFNYFDDQGNYAGICSDYIRILNKTTRYRDGACKGPYLDQVLEKAKAKRLDVVSAVVRTKEREQYLNFTKPYLGVPLVIITRQTRRL